MFNTSDEAFQLFQTGQYDVGSFSGDSALRSIVNGDTAPIKLSRVKTYGDLAAFMKDQAWNSYKGKTYGVPHGWGANVLMWNAGRRDAGAHVVERRLRQELALLGQDHRARQPDLHRGRGAVPVEDPARPRDHEPLRARPEAVRRRGRTAEAAEGQHRRVLGLPRPRSRRPSRRRAAWSAQRGSTRRTWCEPTGRRAPRRWRPPFRRRARPAWSDNWFVHSDAKHPNCAYAWINWITSPKVQAQESEYYGEAPANLKACTLTSDGGAHLGTPDPTDADPATTNCTAYHAEDPSVLRAALVLGHADDQVPRRPHEREVRRVQGLALGLGRDQGQLTARRRPHR